jgi:hypothetical protein
MEWVVENPGLTITMTMTLLHCIFGAVCIILQILCLRVLLTQSASFDIE